VEEETQYHCLVKLSVGRMVEPLGGKKYGITEKIYYIPAAATKWDHFGRGKTDSNN
jgi:hypothetical protein